MGSHLTDEERARIERFARTPAHRRRPDMLRPDAESEQDTEANPPPEDREADHDAAAESD